MNELANVERLITTYYKSISYFGIGLQGIRSIVKMAVNKCDELFGKNGELVEFRKKQVLEGALGIIQRHYEGKPNKMEMVAAILGKKLGEEFKIIHMSVTNTVKITTDGIEMYSGLSKTWIISSELLLTGEAEIVDEG